MPLQQNRYLHQQKHSTVLGPVILQNEKEKFNIYFELQYLHI